MFRQTGLDLKVHEYEVKEIMQQTYDILMLYLFLGGGAPIHCLIKRKHLPKPQGNQHLVEFFVSH